MEYWLSKVGRDRSQFHPPREHCDVPAENRMLSVFGDFELGEEYELFLHVHENGFSGTALGKQKSSVFTNKPGMCGCINWYFKPDS